MTTEPTPPPQHLSPAWTDAESRTTPPLVGDERELLTAFLDFHRETFALKCAGVPAERLSELAVPPSGLSLHGLVRHLAGVEQWWLEIQFAGDESRPLQFYSDDDPDQDFERLDGDFAEDLAVWRAQVETSRRIAAEAPSLDATGIQKSTGQPVSLRRILLGMLAEYARHNGHADLLRERIDGTTGY
ncbi:DinB family protein [Kitasatospora sp. NPDC059795]|uniref:DinB family protein n=1 Tax=Kitasatospora sp. NPDC059795 TaxID=3346949 RepID=UPI00364DF1A1